VKAQWKLADRSGARYAVMLGAREAERGVVGIKDLRAPDAEQSEVPRAELVAWLRRATATTPGPATTDRPPGAIT
jgi:histidyl-tRNA synthetase